MNQLYQQLNQIPQNAGSLANNFSQPQIQQMLNIVKMSGKSAKDLFFMKAQEMGIDPNTILAQLK